MRKIIMFCLLCSIGLVGCGPSESEIQATVQISLARTQTAIPTTTALPTITPQASPVPAKTYPSIRNAKADLGISADDLIAAFSKFGFSFTEGIIEETGLKRIQGLKGPADLIMDVRSGRLIYAEYEIFVDLISDENTPGLGELPSTIFGEQIYKQTISPWLTNYPTPNPHTICFDGYVAHYSKRSENTTSISLGIFLQQNWDNLEDCE